MDKKTMTVKEFITKYESLNNSQIKEKFVKDIRNDYYMPFIEKQALAIRLAEKTMVNDKNNTLEINTPVRFLFSTMEVIYNYTILERPDKENNWGLEVVNDYDMLQKAGLLDYIVQNCVPKNESEIFNTILAMVCDDLVANKYDTHNFAYELTGMVTHTLVNMLEPLAPLLEKIGTLDEEDWKKVNNNLGKVVDFATK